MAKRMAKATSAAKRKPARRAKPLAAPILPALVGVRLEQLAAAFPDTTTFAKKVGISVVTYYSLVNGTGNPTALTLERIAHGLGISVWKLLGISDEAVAKELKSHHIDFEELCDTVRQQAQLSAQRSKLRMSAVKKSARKRVAR